MKKIALAIMLVTGVSNAAWQCYAVNSYGNTFWGTGYSQYQASSNALYSCQLNTPYGARCWVTSTCDWF